MKEQAKEIIQDWMPGSGAEDYVTSVYCQARLPEPMYVFFLIFFNDHVRSLETSI